MTAVHIAFCENKEIVLSRLVPILSKENELLVISCRQKFEPF